MFKVLVNWLVCEYGMLLMLIDEMMVDDMFWWLMD